MGWTASTWISAATFLVLFAQLGVLLAAAAVAYGQVREARTLRQEQIRPVVVVDFDTEGALFFLTVTNLGTTLARNVRITVDPPLESAIDDQTDRIADLQIFGQDGIPMLAPGKMIRTLFDAAHLRDARDQSTRLPDRYTAQVSYDDSEGERHFDDTMSLDLGVYWGLQRVERSDLHDVHQRIVELVRVLESWSARGGGLLAMSEQEVRTREEARLAAYRDRMGKSGLSDATADGADAP